MNFAAMFVAIGLIAQDPLKKVLLKFRRFHRWTVRDAHEGIGLFGVPGSGKTTAIRCILGALLRAGFGGVALSVKPSSVADVEETIVRAGRASDLHVLNGTNGERYNPFNDLKTAADAAAMLGEIASIASGLNQQQESNEAFWPLERNRLLLHLCELCRAHFGRIDAELLSRVLRSLPLTQAELQDPHWQANSLAWEILQKHGAHPDANIRQACVYVSHDFALQHHRMQGSILAMTRSTLDRLLREPLATLFSGKSTVTMEDVRVRGHIILVGLPALASVDGRIANAIIQYCFCQNAKASRTDKDSFFLSDECQETATKELMSSLALLREHRVCCILATQSLGTLNMKLGKDVGEALIDLLGTLVFLQQTQKASREWASGRIGTKKIQKETFSKSDQGRSRSFQEEWVPKVPEAEFLNLKPGRSICARGSKFWRCRWPKNGESGWFTVNIAKGLSTGETR